MITEALGGFLGNFFGVTKWNRRKFCNTFEFNSGNFSLQALYNGINDFQLFLPRENAYLDNSSTTHNC